MKQGRHLGDRYVRGLSDRATAAVLRSCCELCGQPVGNFRSPRRRFGDAESLCFDHVDNAIQTLRPIHIIASIFLGKARLEMLIAIVAGALDARAIARLRTDLAVPIARSSVSMVSCSRVGESAELPESKR